MMPVVLAVSSHGLPLARSLAGVLQGTADVLVVGKLHVPWAPDVCMGAIVEGGDTYLDQQFIDALGLTDEQVAEVADEEYTVVAQNAAAWRGDRQRADLHDRTVVVVGDSHASPGQVEVAVLATRAGGASRVIVAVPPEATEIIDRVRDEADAIVDAHDLHVLA